MSYELYLKPRDGKLSFQQLKDYFGSKPQYKIEGDTFNYNNGDTGVYFSLHYVDDGDSYPLCFQMNYYRPSFFAFEAEGELNALVLAFGLVVSDPQSQGMGEGEYDGEKFLEGWRNGNAYAYQAVHEMRTKNNENINVLTLAQQDLHGMWGWNKNRDRYQQHLGKAYYVPPIWPMNIGGAITTATMWPDGIPTFIPKAKFLIIPRDRFGPSDQEGKKKDMAIVPWEQAAPLIGRYSEKIQDDGFLINSYKDVPDDVEKFIKQLPASSVRAQRLAFDSVLDDELWQSEAQ